MNLKFSFFCHFSWFLWIFHCVSHSRSRQTKFSWTFPHRHSVSFLSNFSGNDVFFDENVDFFHTHQYGAGGQQSTKLPSEGRVEQNYLEKLFKMNLKQNPLWEKNIYFSLFNFRWGPNFISTSLALHTFFLRGYCLQTSKIYHQLQWRNMFLDNSNVQMPPKKLLKLGADGKPSTWLPPERLVELLSQKIWFIFSFRNAFHTSAIISCHVLC